MEEEQCFTPPNTPARLLLTGSLLEGSSGDPSQVGRCPAPTQRCGPLSCILGFTGVQTQPFASLQRCEAPERPGLCLPLTAVQSPQLKSCLSGPAASPALALGIGAAHSWTLQRQGQGESEEQGVNLPSKPEGGEEACPSSPCPKYCHFPERSRAQLSSRRAEADGVGARAGTWRERHLETCWPGGGMNTTAFLCLALGHSSLSFPVVSCGRSHLVLLFQGHFFKKQKEREWRRWVWRERCTKKRMETRRRTVTSRARGEGGRGRARHGRASLRRASAAVAPALPYQRHTAAGWARGGGVVAGPHSGADPRGRYPCP